MVFYVATLLIVTGVALYVASPLVGGLGRTRRTQSREELVVEHWEHEHALAVQGLRELEFDRQMGKLADADYQALRAALETKALEAMSALEKIHEDIRQKRLASLEAAKVKPAPPAAESLPAPFADSSPELSAPETTATLAYKAPAAVPVHPGAAEQRWTPGASVGDHYRASNAPRLRFCPRCGFRVLSTSNFCGECGAQLRTGERVITRAS